MSGAGGGLLRGLVFVTGLGEFLTGLVMLFVTDLAKRLYGIPLDSDPFWLHQVGMFNVLVGGFMLLGSFRMERITYTQFTLSFHAVSLIFEAVMGLIVLDPSDPRWLPTVGFLLYHVVMTPLLGWAMKRHGVPYF